MIFVSCNIKRKRADLSLDLGTLAPDRYAFVSIQTNAMAELETILTFTEARCVSTFGGEHRLRVLGDTLVSAFRDSAV